MTAPGPSADPGGRSRGNPRTLALLVVGIYGLALISTDSSGLARAIVWKDADVLDYQRFPALAVDTPIESSTFEAPGADWDEIEGRIEAPGVFWAR